MFDLYGDHLSARGYQAPVGAVVALLAAVGVSGSATRTAISRLVAQGWLEPTMTGGVRGYQASAAARTRLSTTHARVYRREPRDWDGRWRLLVSSPPGDRAARDRLAATLGFLGYGRLAPHTWISPWPHPERHAALQALGARWEELTAEHDGDPVGLARRVWDLSALAARYEDFAQRAEPLRSLGPDTDPATAYRERTLLVHEWRTFLFADPDLPPAVLPPAWPGTRARALFLEVADTLLPPARRFVDQSLARAAGRREEDTDDPS